MPPCPTQGHVANEGVQGRVLDETGAPLPGLRVDARDVDVFRDDPLGGTRTDAAGRFQLRYRPDDYRGLVDTRPDLQLRVRDEAGIRTLAETPTFRQVTDPVLDVGDIIVPRLEARGFAATAGSGRPLLTSRGNRIEPLIDGEAVFAEAVRLLDQARSSVWLMQLLFQPDFQPTFDGERKGRTLVEALHDASARGVDVRILLNENAIIPDHVDDVREAAEDATPAPRARKPLVWRFPMSPAVMHAKALIRDGEEALLIGQPFEQRFWDTSAHRFDEPRRGETMPVHDMTLHIRGPAVADVAGLFVELWNLRSDEEQEGQHKLATPAPPPRAGDATAQLVLTMPPGHHRPEGERTILESYERALAQASSFAYFETQYFTSAAMARTLRKALDADPDLEVILVLNESMDIPLYNQWQKARLAEIGFPDHPRVRAYSPWQIGTRDGRPTIRTVYVHSKLALIDDKWMTAGTANLDGISLEGGREFGLHMARSIDASLTVLDGVDGEPSVGLAKALRLRLWSEMLGLPADALRERPQGGWRELFDAAAERNLASLAETGALADGMLLPHKATIPENVDVLERGMKPFTL